MHVSPCCHRLSNKKNPIAVKAINIYSLHLVGRGVTHDPKRPASAFDVVIWEDKQ